MKVFLYLFAVGSGLMNSVQAGCNAALGKSIGQMTAAAVVGLVIAASGLLFGAVSGQLAWPGADKMHAAPWWAWFGGVIAAVFILSQLFVAPQVGAGVFIALTVTASVVSALLLDHFGLVGFEVHPAGWGRISGALLMFAGLALIAKYRGRGHDRPCCRPWSRERDGAPGGRSRQRRNRRANVRTARTGTSAGRH